MTREYQGAGGLRLHLDEPLSDEMAKQVGKGHLVLVAQEEPSGGKPEEGSAAQALDDADTQTSSSATDGVNTSPPATAKRPNANSPVADWRAYAVSLGMPEDDAKATTKADLQEYVQVADGGSEG